MKKKDPEPIIFPANDAATTIPHPKLDTERLSRLADPLPFPNLPASAFTPTTEYIVEETLKKCLYTLLRSEETVNIAVMSYEEFEAFWQRVMEAE